MRRRQPRALPRRPGVWRRSRSQPARLYAAAEELATYLRRNAGQIIDYGERHGAGERISTGFVGSAVNQIVSKCFSKR